jgi:hypothetical protein
VTKRKPNLKQVLSVAHAAGLEIARVTVGADGSITVETGRANPPDDLDQELAAFEVRHGNKG